MTISEDVRDVTNGLIAKLPPAQVLLLALIFLYVGANTWITYWFMHDQSIARIEAVTKIFQACTAALSK